jgi:hypothetical protein
VCYDGDATPVPMIFIWDFYKGITGLEMNWVGKKNYFHLVLLIYWIVPLEFWKKSILLQHFLTGRKFFVWQLLRRNPKKSYRIENRILLYRFKTNVPIIPVAFDFGRKEVNPSILPSGT